MATDPPTASKLGRWQFSLRLLLVFIAFVAVASAALLNASSWWQTFIGTTTFAVLPVAILSGLFRRGRV